MTKISNLITIHSGYTEYVQLVPTFTNPTKNRGRMEQYMPIKSHREAFSRLTRSLYPLDSRVYLLTGSYGTGKSNLCLMLANYLTLKPSDPASRLALPRGAVAVASTPYSEAIEVPVHQAPLSRPHWRPIPWNHQSPHARSPAGGAAQGKHQ